MIDSSTLPPSAHANDGNMISLFRPMSDNSSRPTRPTTIPVFDASSSHNLNMSFLTTIRKLCPAEHPLLSSATDRRPRLLFPVVVLGFAILAFFAYSLSRIVRSARKQNSLSRSGEVSLVVRVMKVLVLIWFSSQDGPETARIIEDSEESQPQTYGTISSEPAESSAPHSDSSKNSTKIIIPRNSNATLRIPSINHDGSTSTEASSITVLDSSSSHIDERSDTSSVHTDCGGVIQDLELAVQGSRKENHDLRSELDAAREVNAACEQTISGLADAVEAGDQVNRDLAQRIEQLENDKAALAARMESAVEEKNRLADVNAEMTKGIEIRDRNNALVEANRNTLRQHVKKLVDEKAEMASAQRDLESQIEQLQTEAEMKRTTLVRKIAKLERERASLGGEFNALSQRNAESKQRNEELVQQYEDAFEQYTVVVEEYKSLKSYTQDLENHLHQLESEHGLKDADDTPVVPKPLDYSGVGRANVKLLENVACLQAEKAELVNLVLALDRSCGRVQHGEEHTSDDVQQCAPGVCDIPAIVARPEDSPEPSMSAQFEQLEAVAASVAEAALADDDMPPPVFVNQISARTASPVSAQPADAAVGSSSSTEDNTFAHLQTLKQRVTERLVGKPAIGMHLASPFHLPFTPLAPAYQASSSAESSEGQTQPGSETDILGTPLHAQVDIPTAAEIFGPHPDAPPTLEFSLGAAPPCHRDAYTWAWVHAETLEDEDLDEDDQLTPSPTTWHVADPNKEDLYAANREAAYASGEIF